MADVEILTRRLDPMEAELWVRAPGEIAGRFMGPRSLYASTIEVAYYLQSPRRGEEFAGKRVVIPEPSLWTPATPFLYEAVLTVDGCKVATRHGLRSLEWTPHGIRLNQKPFEVKSTRCERITETQLRSLRDEGYNTVVCPIDSENHEAWTWADRIGMFVIGILKSPPDDWPIVRPLQSRASCLGWQQSDGRTIEAPEPCTSFRHGSGVAGFSERGGSAKLKG